MGSETRESEERAFRPWRTQSRAAIAPLACLSALPATGCALSRSVNILGSFFPAWLISIVTGLVLALVVWRVLVATGIAPHLTPPALVYPCLAALLIFASWLVLFAG
jgi:YtcA-like protein